MESVCQTRSTERLQTEDVNDKDIALIGGGTTEGYHFHKHGWEDSALCKSDMKKPKRCADACFRKDHQV